MPAPRFSVVVPVHDKRPHLQRSIGSVLAQSLTDFELIIIDDASTDGSLAAILAFDDARIRVLRRGAAGPGGYAARNLGIREARADWVAFLDADDEWTPHHLQGVAALLDDDPDATFVSSGRLSVGASRSPRMDAFWRSVRPRRRLTLSLADYLAASARGRRAVGTDVVVFARRVLGGEPLFPEGRTRAGGDLYAWVKLLARCGSLRWSPHVGAVSHRDSVNMVSRTNVPNPQLWWELVEELAPELEPDEIRLLKRYANREIRRAWTRNRLAGASVPPLAQHLYWRDDAAFCALSCAVFTLPPVAIRGLRRLKQA